MNTLTHSRPLTRPVIIQINLDVSLLFWPLYALLWLSWLALVGVGRTIRRIYEIARAVVVVAGRRLKRWLQGSEQRCAWVFSGLVYGPVVGVG
jgi:hypothetical protein